MIEMVVVCVLSGPSPVSDDRIACLRVDGKVCLDEAAKLARSLCDDAYMRIDAYGCNGWSMDMRRMKPREENSDVAAE